LKKLFSLVLAFLYISLFSDCNFENAKWKGTIEEDDGIILVKNPKKPMYGPEVFIIEEELSIGNVEEEQVFKIISDIAVNENEDIYILDSNLRQIRVFDKNGKYIRDISKSGQGPGEFQFPVQILISPNQEFVINDMMIRRLLFYSLEGEFKRATPTWKIGRPLRVLFNSNNEVFGEVLLGGDKQGFSLRRFSTELEELGTIATKERDKLPLLESLSPKIAWNISKEDEIIWGDSENYEIYIEDKNGKLVKEIIKKYRPERIIEEEYSEQIDRKFGGRPIPPEFAQELPKYYPAFQSFAMDDSGRLFVHTFEKDENGEGYYNDVFDAAGKYIVKILLETHPRLWKKGKLYSTEADEEGNLYVKRFKVTWNY